MFQFSSSANSEKEKELAGEKFWDTNSDKMIEYIRSILPKNLKALNGGLDDKDCEREKFWFAYRRKEEIKDCEEQYYIFGCKDEKTMILDCKKYLGPCECGRDHELRTKLVVCEYGALKNFDKYMAECNKGTGMQLPRALKPFFQFVLPLLILVILVEGLR